MSLKFFHKVFILASLTCLLFTARWASGHNAASVVAPWLLYSSLTGITLLVPYAAWYSRSR
jgi:hypothetical protein